MNRLFAKVIRNISRNHKILYSQNASNNGFSVSPYCKLHVNCSFNVKIRPLDVHMYPDSDKLFIKLESDTPLDNLNFKYLQNKDDFYLTSDSKDVKGVQCYIEAPIKSDLNIATSGRGSIDVQKFRGDGIILKSESGDIISENCQNSFINYVTESGNIISKGTLHAGDIQLETRESGCIIVNHLQALTVKVKTEDGDVNTKSSYCEESSFETQTGKLILSNVHKNCSVSILDCGILQMVGFDGTLNVNMKSGEADIQLSKLHEVSKINVEEKSPVLIRISETLIDNTRIETNCPSLAIGDTIKMTIDKNENRASLTPLSSKYSSELFINSELSHIVIDEASWADMVKLGGRNF